MDSIKVDGCAADLHTFNVTYPKLGKYLNKTGRQIFYTCSWPVYFLLSDTCNGTFSCVPWKQVAAACNSWRVYRDIMDIWYLPTHAGIRNIIEFWATNNATLTSLNAVGAYNDPDMLLSGNGGLSDKQSVIQIVMWAMWSAPMLMSNDLSAISPTLLKTLLNEEIIAIDQDTLARSASAIKLGDVELNSVVQLWVKPLNDTSVAAAVVNLGCFDGQPFVATVTAQQLGFGDSTLLHARDVLARSDIGNFRGKLTFTLRPYDVVMIRVTRT